MTGILIIAFKLSRYSRKTLLLGSLSYFMRGNLSLLTGIYYSGFIAYKKGNFVFREVISSLNLSYLSGIFWLEIA